MYYRSIGKFLSYVEVELGKWCVLGFFLNILYTIVC